MCISHSCQNLMQVACLFCAGLSKWRPKEQAASKLKLWAVQVFHFQPQRFNVPLTLSCFQSRVAYYFCSYPIRELVTQPTQAHGSWEILRSTWIFSEHQHSLDSFLREIQTSARLSCDFIFKNICRMLMSTCKLIPSKMSDI